MPVIILTTYIQAPQQVVFDASRSIDLHTTSMAHTGERAVAGKMSGLVEEDETVTWRARHFFKTRQLTIVITHMQPYTFFADEMTKGDFRSMLHKHYFTSENGMTVMKDVFTFTVPYGVAGRLANLLFVTGYMKRLLLKRNQAIKQYTESIPATEN